MNRFVLLILSAVLTLGLTACGTQDKKDKDKKKSYPHKERYERRW